MWRPLSSPAAPVHVAVGDDFVAHALADELCFGDGLLAGTTGVKQTGLHRTGSVPEGLGATSNEGAGHECEEATHYLVPASASAFLALAPPSAFLSSTAPSPVAFFGFLAQVTSL
jgi:hypothetical protein